MHVEGTVATLADTLADRSRPRSQPRSPRTLLACVLPGRDVGGRWHPSWGECMVVVRQGWPHLGKGADGTGTVDGVREPQLRIKCGPRTTGKLARKNLHVHKATGYTDGKTDSELRRWKNPPAGCAAPRKVQVHWLAGHWCEHEPRVTYCRGCAPWSLPGRCWRSRRWSSTR